MFTHCPNFQVMKTLPPRNWAPGQIRHPPWLSLLLGDRWNWFMLDVPSEWSVPWPHLLHSNPKNPCLPTLRYPRSMSRACSCSGQVTQACFLVVTGIYRDRGMNISRVKEDWVTNRLTDAPTCRGVVGQRQQQTLTRLCGLK